MGLLDSIVETEEDNPCPFGLIITQRLANADGERLDDDDCEAVFMMRVHGRGAPVIHTTLVRAGFRLSQSTVSKHLAGGCYCKFGTPLKGQPRGSA